MKLEIRPVLPIETDSINNVFIAEGRQPNIAGGAVLVPSDQEAIDFINYYTVRSQWAKTILDKKGVYCGFYFVADNIKAALEMLAQFVTKKKITKFLVKVKWELK